MGPMIARWSGCGRRGRIHAGYMALGEVQERGRSAAGVRPPTADEASTFAKPTVDRTVDRTADTEGTPPHGIYKKTDRRGGAK